MSKTKKIAIKIDNSELVTDFTVTLSVEEGLNRTFDAVIGKQYISDSVDMFVKDSYSKDKPNIHGFAQGKAPLFVIKKHYSKLIAQNPQRYGVKSLEDHILLSEIRRLILSVYKEFDIKPALDPKYTKMDNYSADADFKFSFSVDILPELPEVALDKVNVEYPRAEVSEDDVLKAMNEWASRNFRGVALKKQRAAESGDTVIIDLEIPGEKDGLKDFSVRLGAGVMAKDFEEQLVGKSAGDVFSHMFLMPNNFQDASLAGRSFKVKVTVKEVQETKPYEVNEEMAKALSTPSIEACKDKFKAQLLKDEEKMSMFIAKRNLLNAIGAAADFEVPQGMIDNDMANRLNLLSRVIGMQVNYPVSDEQKKAVNDIMKDRFEKDFDTWYEERLKASMLDVKAWLILLKYGDTKNINITKQDIDQAVADKADNFRGGLAEAMEYYAKDMRARRSLEMELREDKIVKEVLRFVKIKEKKMSMDDLSVHMQDMSKVVAEKSSGKPKAKTSKKVSEEKPAKKPAAKKSSKSESK